MNLLTQLIVALTLCGGMTVLASWLLRPQACPCGPDSIQVRVTLADGDPIIPLDDLLEGQIYEVAWQGPRSGDRYEFAGTFAEMSPAGRRRGLMLRFDDGLGRKRFVNSRWLVELAPFCPQPEVDDESPR